jgi:hypothetical protein
LDVDIPLKEPDCLPRNETSSNRGYNYPTGRPGEPDEEYSNQENVLRTRHETPSGTHGRRMGAVRFAYPAGVEIPEDPQVI